MWRAKQHIVVDVGISQIKIACLQLSKGGILIKKLILDDTREVKRDKFNDKIKHILETSFTKQELSSASISILLSYPFVEIKRLEFPSMPHEEICNAITWQAKDKIALDIDKSIFDFIVLEELTDESGSKKLVVMVAISPADVINRFANISKELKLEILGINASPFFLSNILNEQTKADKRDKEESIAVAEIGYGHTYISLYKHGKLAFLRVIPVASDQITKSMAGVFTLDAGDNIELKEAEAEALKKKYGIPLDITDEFLDSRIPTKQTLAKMRPVLESLSTEIKRSFDYYTSELNGTDPKTVFLTGGGAQIKNLDVFLKDDLGREVKCIRLPETLKNESNLDASVFLNAVSASMGDLEEGPNLLPIEFRKRRLQLIEKVSIRMIAFTVFSILFLSYIILIMKEADYKSRLVSVKSHRAVIQHLVDTYNQVSQRNELLAKLSSGSFLYINIFKEISSIISPDIMLEHISINEDKKILRIKGKLFLGAGAAEEALVSFIQDIEKSSLFKEANLLGVTRSGSQAEKIYDFSIKCRIE